MESDSGLGLAFGLCARLGKCASVQVVAFSVSYRGRYFYKIKKRNWKCFFLCLECGMFLKFSLRKGKKKTKEKMLVIISVMAKMK